MTLTTLALLGVLTHGALAVPLRADDDATPESPFDDIRWADGRPEVRVGDAWYVPIAIDAVPIEAVLAACAARWPGEVERRFAEDLRETLALLETPLSSPVDLTVRPVGSDVTTVLEAVDMTNAKRRRLWRKRFDAARAPSQVTHEQAVSDLQALAARIETHFAYRGLTDVDATEALRVLGTQLADPVDTHALALQLHRLVSTLGDGHAWADVAVRGPKTKRLPFRIVQAAEGPVGLTVQEGQPVLVHPDTPVVEALDGQPLDAWIARASAYVAAGSPQLVRRRSLSSLTYIDRLRREATGEIRDTIDVTWTGPGGRVTETLPLVADRVRVPDPPVDTNLVPPTWNLERIERMEPEVIRAALASLDDHRDAEAWILDLRGNGGGTRDLVVGLLPRLLDADSDPLVVNVARHRLADDFAPGHLDDRFLFPVDSPDWSPAEREAIDATMSGFRPRWDPGPDGYSAWHAMVVSRGPEAPPPFTGPVAVLADAGCFSATDIFLGAISLLPQVTLVGQPSSGGSARGVRWTLPHSRIEVNLASMASYRPDGRLYDGEGIEVDVAVWPQAADLVGPSDAVLVRAVEVLRQRLAHRDHRPLP